MAKKPDKNLLVALDIGTSKIAALVGEQTHNNQIEIIGFGSHPSYGLKRGVVVDIGSTVRAIQRAVEEAELMAGCEIRSVTTGIAGGHVRGFNSQGIVAIRDREVKPADVTRVIEAAKAVPIPADQKILHVLPQEFTVDSQENVREPVGMSGVRLEAKVHIVTGAVSAAQNIMKCVRSCGLQVSNIILQPLASSYAVLTDDEKKLGVCVVDIGAGTTDIAVFTEGSIRHTAVIPIAGDHVTNDLAVALRTPTQYAEQIKLQHASIALHLMDTKESIQVPGVAKRPAKRIHKKELAQVVSARYEELFSLVLQELRRNSFENLIPAGIVLTGGASRMEGVIELAESVLDLPVRLGLPQNIQGLVDVRENPSYATGAGLLMHSGKNQESVPTYQVASASGMWLRMKDWFRGNF